MRGAEERGLSLESTSKFEARPGKGVGARVVGLGNIGLLRELGVDEGRLAAPAEALRRRGQTVMFVAVDGSAAGLLGVADPVKETTPEAIAQLKRDGLRIVMLTGDARASAEAVASASRRPRGRSAAGTEGRNREAPSRRGPHGRDGWRRSE